jgi:hypothetical protein
MRNNVEGVFHLVDSLRGVNVRHMLVPERYMLSIVVNVESFLADDFLASIVDSLDDGESSTKQDSWFTERRSARERG